MSFKIAICDDDPIFCKKLENQLTEYSLSHIELDLCIDIFHNGENFLQSANNNKYQIVFLDIELNSSMNGITIAQMLRNTLTCYLTEIVFISTHSDYSLQLFQVQPLEFIIKTSEQFPISNIFTLYQQYHVSSKLFHYNKITVPYANIHYFECQGKKCILHQMDQNLEFRLNESFSNFCKTISAHQFSQVNQSFCVNNNYIGYIQNNIITLKNGENVTLSAKYQKMFYLQYMGD